MRLMLIFGMLLLGGCAQSVAELAKGISSQEAHYSPSKGQDMKEALGVLSKRLTELGITIYFQPEEQMPQGWGFSIVEHGVIVIDESMPIDGQFEVLAHEAGHFFHPREFTRSQREAFAEAVMVGVAEFFGKDLRKTSASYMAQYKDGLTVMEFYQKDVEEAVKVLTKKG